MTTLIKKSNFLFLLLFLFSLITKVEAQKAQGEPVPGAEIYIELEPDDEPITNVITNEDGEFEIVFSNSDNNLPNVGNLPSMGTFVFTVKPSKSFALKYKLIDKKLQKVKVNFNKQKDGKLLKNGNLVFKYTLTWVVDAKAQNKGAFAVSGKNDT